MRKIIIFAGAALLAVGMFHSHASLAQPNQTLLSRILGLADSYRRVDEMLEIPQKAGEQIAKGVANEQIIQSALADSLLGPDLSALREQYGVAPFAEPRPPAPPVSLNDLRGGGVLAERALAMLEQYAAALGQRRQAIDEALRNANHIVEELAALQRAAADAADKAEQLIQIHARPEVVAILWERDLASHYLKQKSSLDSVDDAARSHIADWQREIARLEKLRQKEAAELANLNTNIANVILPVVQANRAQNPSDRAIDLNREIRLTGGDGLPATFSGMASDTEFTTAYFGTRNGPLVSGQYTGSEGSGSFSGVLDRALRVRGQYRDTSGERGSFIGRATPMLDKVIGSINCLSNCD